VLWPAPCQSPAVFRYASSACHSSIWAGPAAALWLCSFEASSCNECVCALIAHYLWRCNRNHSGVHVGENGLSSCPATARFQGRATKVVKDCSRRPRYKIEPGENCLCSQEKEHRTCAENAPATLADVTALGWGRSQRLNRRDNGNADESGIRLGQAKSHAAAAVG
jgi:hypothetical protein